MTSADYLGSIVLHGGFHRSRQRLIPPLKLCPTCRICVTYSSLFHVRDCTRGSVRQRQFHHGSHGGAESKTRDVGGRAAAFGRWVLITGGQSEASLAEWILMEAV